MIVMLGAAIAPLLVAMATLLNLPPCEHEDSHWCYWDAQARGNHQGQSFINLDPFGD